jgi:Mlc titration factor MtfA (ptsG expression regulator)
MKKYIYINILFGIFLSSFFTLMIGAMLAYVLRNKDHRIIILSIVLSLLFFILLYIFSGKKIKSLFVLQKKFPEQCKDILNEYVSFYKSLEELDQNTFEKQVMVFLSQVQVTGIGAKVDDVTRLLVAASAVIPTIRFSQWHYSTVLEILIYPGNFDENYNFKSSSQKNIMGMVAGNSSTVILSKPALFEGFASDSDGLNTGIHDILQKIEQEDGLIDGMPSLFLTRKEKKQWRRIIDNESSLIEKGQSDINPYALTNDAEFFAVVSEYFFEKPNEMLDDHHELYLMMKKIFKQDLVSQLKKTLRSVVSSGRLGRNAPCHCGSGKKYKKCCMYKDRENGNNH